MSGTPLAMASTSAFVSNRASPDVMVSTLPPFADKRVAAVPGPKITLPIATSMPTPRIAPMLLSAATWKDNARRFTLENLQREARTNTIGDVRFTKHPGERMLGAPAGAVRGHDQTRLQRGKIGADAIDQRLVQRAIQVKAAEDPVHLGCASERERVASDVDN